MICSSHTSYSCFCTCIPVHESLENMGFRTHTHPKMTLGKIEYSKTEGCSEHLPCPKQVVKPFYKRGPPLSQRKEHPPITEVGQENPELTCLSGSSRSLPPITLLKLPYSSSTMHSSSGLAEEHSALTLSFGSSFSYEGSQSHHKTNKSVWFSPVNCLPQFHIPDAFKLWC